MSGDEQAAAEAIIAKCEDLSELESHIIYHATVAVFLVCHMAKLIGQNEAGIRRLYGDWADRAVKEYTQGHPPEKDVSH